MNLVNNNLSVKTSYMKYNLTYMWNLKKTPNK